MSLRYLTEGNIDSAVFTKIFFIFANRFLINAVKWHSINLANLELDVGQNYFYR